MLDSYDWDKTAALKHVSELMSLDLNPSDSISSYKLCGAEAIAKGVSPQHAFSIVGLVANICFAVLAQERVNPFVLPVMPAPYGE
jgi:hypothetical protein